MTAMGTAIKRLREERGWTQTRLGKKVGLDGTNIARRERGDTKVKPSERYQFAEAFGLSLAKFDDTWRVFNTERTRGGRGIPLINKAPAGEVHDYEEYGVDSGQGHEYLDYGDIRDDQAFAVEIVGNSMQPRLNEGDRVIFSYCDPYRDDGKLTPGRIVFVRFAEGEVPKMYSNESRSGPQLDGGCMVARFYPLNEGQILLRKDNPEWPPILVNQEAVQNLSVAIERREKLE
ncbi:MAG: LexA family transcriptional regulator [Planctomycetota bacterium]